MGSTDKRGDELDTAVAFEMAFRRLAPALYQGLYTEKGHRLREFGVLRAADGGWLAKAKAASVDGTVPVIAWGQGVTPSDAIRRLNRSVQNGAWKKDEYPGKNWAR